MTCPKTMVCGGQVPTFSPNRGPHELLKDDGILMQQMLFSESPEFRGVRGGVWGPESHTSQGVDHMKISKTMVSGGEGTLFLPKPAYLRGYFRDLFANFSATKSRDLVQKRRLSAQT